MFEQFRRTGGADGFDRVAHRAVVDGVVQVVGPAGRGEVGLEVDVDLERLGAFALLGQDAATGRDLQPTQLDAIGGDGDKKKRKEFETALKALQTSLGRLNDMAQANEAAIEALGGSSSASLTFAAGEIVGRLRSREPKMLARAEAAYDGFAEAKRFWPKAKTPRKPKPAPQIDGPVEEAAG